jgi:hypothetical protein
MARKVIVQAFGTLSCHCISSRLFGETKEGARPRIYNANSLAPLEMLFWRYRSGASAWHTSARFVGDEGFGTEFSANNKFDFAGGQTAVLESFVREPVKRP